MCRNWNGVTAECLTLLWLHSSCSLFPACQGFQKHKELRNKTFPTVTPSDDPPVRVLPWIRWFEFTERGGWEKKKIAQNLFCEVVKDCQATHSSWEPRRKTWCCYNCSGTSHMCYRQCTPGLLLSQVICSSHPSNFAHLHTPLISSVAMQCFFDLSIIFWPKVCWCWDLTGMNAVPFKIT